MGRVVKGASFLWGELSMGRVVHVASCPWGELSMGRVFYGPMGQVVRGASFDGATGPGTVFFCIGQVSIISFSFGDYTVK